MAIGWPTCPPRSARVVWNPVPRNGYEKGTTKEIAYVYRGTTVTYQIHHDSCRESHYPHSAEWTEIDRDEGVWTVPARRTKANREHRVPLCARAVEILDGARKLVEGTSPFLFPNRVGKQLEEKQLRRMLGKHGIAAVPHGFRSSFRDWAAEETNHPREVIEAALAHVVQNRVEAAYRRTDLFDRRRRPGDHQTDGSGNRAGQNDSSSSHSFVLCGLPHSDLVGRLTPRQRSFVIVMTI